jgi:hypothetical protein
VERLNITLDDEQAEKLSRLAERCTSSPEPSPARSCPARSTRQHPDARNVVELLDGVSGAYERAQLGLRQAQAGRTVPLDEL